MFVSPASVPTNRERANRSCPLVKKQELVHLHRLFAAISDEFQQRTGRTADCEECDHSRIGPTSIHRPKADHEDAVRTLATELSTTVPQHSRPQPAVDDSERSETSSGSGRAERASRRTDR